MTNGTGGSVIVAFVSVGAVGWKQYSRE
jgi:hypothetical protein